MDTVPRSSDPVVSTELAFEALGNMRSPDSVSTPAPLLEA